MQNKKHFSLYYKLEILLFLLNITDDDCFSMICWYFDFIMIQLNCWFIAFAVFLTLYSSIIRCSTLFSCIEHILTNWKVIRFESISVSRTVHNIFWLSQNDLRIHWQHFHMKSFRKIKDRAIWQMIVIVKFENILTVRLQSDKMRK